MKHEKSPKKNDNCTKSKKNGKESKDIFGENSTDLDLSDKNSGDDDDNSGDNKNKSGDDENKSGDDENKTPLTR